MPVIFLQGRGAIMTDESQTKPAEPVPEHIPAMQRLLDNPFLLLFFGVTVPAAIYLIWGLMEISQMPIAK
jgi:hypothetical protein